jgi:hypothetical protein
VRGNLIRTVGMAIGAVVAILGFAAAARADEKTMAKVPFDFVAGGVRLPAGSYTIAETENPGVLLVQDEHRRHAVFVLTIAATGDGTTPPELVFQHTGGDYFLARIVEAGAQERDVVGKRPAPERESASIAVTMTDARR